MVFLGMKGFNLVTILRPYIPEGVFLVNTLFYITNTTVVYYIEKLALLLAKKLAVVPLKEINLSVD